MIITLNILSSNVYIFPLKGNQANRYTDSKALPTFNDATLNIRTDIFV